MKDININLGVMFVDGNKCAGCAMVRSLSIPLIVKWRFFYIFQSMKDLNIRPGVVLMVTNVRVMLRLDPQHPSHLQRHVYLSSTAESQVNIWTNS